MADKIITEFELNIDGYLANINKVIDATEGFDKSAKDTQKGLSDVGGKVGSASQRFDEFAAAADASADALQGYAKQADDARKKSKQLTDTIAEQQRITLEFQKELDQVNKRLADVPKGGAAFLSLQKRAEALKEAIKDNNFALKELRLDKAEADRTAKSLADLAKAAGGDSGGLGAALGLARTELAQAFPQLTKLAGAARTVGVAITTALGPVGLIIAAIVAAFGALVKIFAGTQEGIERLNRIIEPLKAGLAATLGVLQEIAKAAVDTLRLLFNVATFNFSGAAEAFNDLKESASGAVDAVRNFGDTLSNALDVGARLAKIKEDLADIAIEIARNEGRINREFQEQLQAASNVNLTAKERAAAGREAIRLQEELTALRLRELDLQIEQLELQQSLNDTTKEELLELTRLQAQREQIVADQLSATRRVNNTINTLQKQAADKAIAEAKRRADEEKKRLEEIAQAELSLAQVKEELANRALSRSLDEFGRRVLAAEIGAEKEINATQKLFDELSRLAGNNKEELERLERERADTILEIRRDLSAKIDALEQDRISADEKKAEDELGRIRAALSTQDQLQRDAINKEFEALASAAERRITNEVELTETLVALEIERQRRLDEVRSEAEIEAAEREAQQIAQRVALIKDTSNKLAGISEAFASGQEDAAKQAGRALLDVALQVLEQQALIATGAAKVLSLSQVDSIATFGASGLARAAVIAGLIRAALAAVRGAVTGAFHDGGLVGRDGGTKVHGGRDGWLTRVERGEYVMPTGSTARYMPYLEAMRDGRFEAMMASHAQYRQTATAVPSFSDRGIVGALGSVGSLSEQRKQTELLAMLAERMARNPSKRYWA